MSGKQGFECHEYNLHNKLVAFQNADLALAPIIVSEERLEMVDFTNPFSDVRIATLSRDAETRSQQRYGVVTNEEIKYFLSLEANRRLKESFQSNGRITHVNSLLEGLDKVRSDHLSLLMESEVADYYVEQEPCDLSASLVSATDFHYSFAVRNNSELLPGLNAALARLQARRSELQRLRAKWWRRDCSGESESSTLEAARNGKVRQRLNKIT